MRRASGCSRPGRARSRSSAGSARKASPCTPPRPTAAGRRVPHVHALARRRRQDHADPARRRERPERGSRSDAEGNAAGLERDGAPPRRPLEGDLMRKEQAMGNPVVHWELMSKDPAKVAGFYEKLFGWKIQHRPELSYRIVDTGAPKEGMPGINGGIVKPEREGPWPG